MDEEIMTPETGEEAPVEALSAEEIPAAEAPVEEPAAEESPAEIPAEPPMVEVVDIQFRPGQKVYFFDPDGLELRVDDHVVIDTARGPEFGYCAGGNHSIRQSQVVVPLRKVIRRATAEDDRIAAENREKEKRAYDICLKKIADHGLDMQLVSAEYAFDGTKIVFYFTADERVDFRELVKNLAGTFHVRIELRQIGVRDKAKMVGGLGICGRPFCCASFLADFQPVSIKMAKTQNLSLNPTKISGTCGRLMCCLKYEQEAYEDLLRTSPKTESFVDTPDGRGTVMEVNLLGQKVRVRMENAPENINTYPIAEIAVLRNGKGKKTDPPIPEDLAPISGAGIKRERKPVKQEESPLLEPVKFRYRMDDVVDENSAISVEEKEAPKPRRPRRPRTEEKPRQRHEDKPKAEEPKEPKEHKEPREQKEPRETKGQKPFKPRQPRQRQGDQIKTLEQPQRPKPPRPPKAERPEKADKPEKKPEAPAAESGEAPAQQNKARRSNYRKPYHHRNHKPHPGGEGKSE